MVVLYVCVFVVFVYCGSCIYVNVCVCMHVYIWNMSINIYVFEKEWNVCDYSVCMCVSEIVVYMECICDCISMVHMCIEICVLVHGTCVICAGKVVAVYVYGVWMGVHI